MLVPCHYSEYSKESVQELVRVSGIEMKEKWNLAHKLNESSVGTPRHWDADSTFKHDKN